MVFVLFGVGVGYVWVCFGYVYLIEFVLCIVFNIGLLCLIFVILVYIWVDLYSFGWMVLVSVLICVCMVVLGWVVVCFGCQEWQVLVLVYSFLNVGNMGLLVCLYVFGEVGMILVVVFYLIMLIGNFSFGVFWMSGECFWCLLLGNLILFSVLLVLLLMGFDL